MILTDFEKDLSKNMLNEEFLCNYNTKLKHYLLELFDKNKCPLRYFLGDEYHYKGRD